MIILDTNVLSELLAPQPNPLVLSWIEVNDFHSLFTTSISKAEMMYGMYRLPKGRRRDELAAMILPMFDRDFFGRVLSFDEAAASIFGKVAAERQSVGRPISNADAQIAAIALSHGAALVTRNVRDFQGIGLTLIDPWRVGEPASDV